ncbi:Diphthamide synthesis protein [Plasmodium coatneyi]|uniref:2-(3-amino-3-carboxypropyl)histidine synthase subunit 1 n=1 Tax=Plasmodium coatneyi TaxID=208452 RepID=A0A1B1E6G5_9APIC|nr:Diphthamide synthesis protein [Plasmodium coatneyi]ANQ10622.1 Diphthamide synthesis protein [Plasmodium coatneyi]
MNQIREKNETFEEKKERKKIHCAIPKFILNNELLQKAIKKCFPENYNFEIYKCIDIILKEKFKNIVLQLPEGLLIWGLYISEILYFFCDCVEDVIILGDVTYGGCCIDDYTSEKLNCDLIIHYGHSCLVPLTVTKIRCIYVFVDIKLNSSHLVETIKKNFKKSDIVLLLGTIQFSCLVHNVHSILKKENYFDLFLPIPQVLPLTKGEVLGCTSPNLYRFLYEHVVRKGEGGLIAENEVEPRQNGRSSGGEAEGEKYPSGDIPPKDDKDSHHSEQFIINECKQFLQKNQVKIVFIADGRFHLESLMIHNPDFSFYRYNPFNKIITEEKYNYSLFHEIRKNEIKKCSNCRSVCIILSTLGRQGNVNILQNILNLVKQKNIYFFILLLSEIFNEKLALFKNVDVFIQIGCPRLSIDWGNYNSKPLLNSYEAYVFLQAVKYKEIYPMDYYANLGNVWTNYNAGIGNTSEKNMSMREIIRRRIQLRKSKISIRYQ